MTYQMRNRLTPVTHDFQLSRSWGLFKKTELSILLPKQECNLRSKIWWFTESCNSHYVSHFAAFFIVQGAKRSIVKRYGLFKLQHEVAKFLTNLVLVKGVLWEPPLVLAAKTHNTKSFTKYVSEKTFRNDAMCFWKRKFTSRIVSNVNDPSAGSPTETLLRLLLPLND